MELFHNHSITLFLAITSALLQIWGYVFYLRKAPSPNPAMWGMWAFGSGVLAISYAELTEKSFEKDILPAVCAITCLVIFFLLIRRKKFGEKPLERVDGWDKTVFSADILITAIYVGTHNPLYATILFQVSNALSFGPTLRAVAKSPSKEHAGAWWIWTGAYFLHAATVILDWQHWGELVYSLTNIVLHGAVALMATNKLRSRR
jgi:hypothetical protein